MGTPPSLYGQPVSLSLLSALLLLAAVPVSAQKLPSWHEPWFAAGRALADGEVAIVKTACAWDAAFLREVERGLSGRLPAWVRGMSKADPLGLDSLEYRPGYDVRNLRAGVVLHTWAFMCVGRAGEDPTVDVNASAELGAGLPARPTLRWVVRREPTELERRRQHHLAIAHTLLEALSRAAPDHQELHAVWHRLLIVWLASRDRYRDAEWVHQVLGADVADDAVALTAVGAVYETAASPWLERFEWSRAYTSHRKAERRQLLRRAESLYRRVLVTAPAFLEARLRHGRVLAELGRSDEARAELERAEDEARDARDKYLAALFLGGLHGAAGRDEEALSAYARAREAWPGSQPALVGRAFVLGRTGRQEEARRELGALGDGSVGERGGGDEGVQSPDASADDDPWWGYVLGVRHWLAPLQKEALSWLER